MHPSSQRTRKKEGPDRLARLEQRLEESLARHEELAWWEAKTERIIEEKLYEIKAIAYLLLLISTAMFALALGMVLNALGLRL